MASRDHLYVIQSATGEIKIGRSANPAARLVALQVGSPQPLRLVMVGSGMGPREAEVHQRLAHHRIYGEWFAEVAMVRLQVEFPELIDGRTPPLPKDLMTTEQATSYARISRSALYRLSSQGQLTRWKIARQVHWSRTELDTLVRPAGEVA